MKKYFNSIPKNMLLFLAVTGAIGLATGLSDPVLSNYFDQVYNVTTTQRGWIELPRELPGMICLGMVAVGAFLGDIKLSMVAQVLSIIGMLVLGIFTPPYAIMLVFLFIYSAGVHLYMPLADSIFMTTSNAAGEDKRMLGTSMGRYKSVSFGFQMLAGLLVFVGFKTGFFSFKTQTKWIFIAAAVFYFTAIILLSRLLKLNPKHNSKDKSKIKFDKDYIYYYILAAMHGAQKQVMLVYGPWVLIRLLGKGPETISVLVIVSAFCGIFFTRFLGKWIDRFGIKNLLIADAISFIAVYLIYGLITGGYESGILPTVGIAVFMAYTIFVMDKMSMNMSMIRVLYLKAIVKNESDVPVALSTGISIDHVISIAFAIFCGFVWDRFGAQYVFYMAAAFSLVNVAVSMIIKYSKRYEHIS